jgi:hypothetical protein
MKQLFDLLEVDRLDLIRQPPPLALAQLIPKAHQVFLPVRTKHGHQLLAIRHLRRLGHKRIMR